MDALELIRTRRSTRKFADRPVEAEKLEQVVEAGRCAPSGGNNQSTHLIVIEKREVLDHLTALVREEFAKMEVTEGMYASMAHSISASKTGNYIFHYNPPVLIVVANKKGYGNAMADSSCALENMMLMANALDLGSCWINQLRWLNENPAVVAYLESLGLARDEIVCGALSLGYAATPDGLPSRQTLKRTGNPVTYVR